MVSGRQLASATHADIRLYDASANSREKVSSLNCLRYWLLTRGSVGRMAPREFIVWVGAKTGRS